MANRLMNEKEQIKNILERLEKLEKEIFSTKKQTLKVGNKKPQNFSGAKGGVLFLLSKKYFDQRRFAPDVKIELSKNNYNYSIQVVQTALNRIAKGKGELVAMKEGEKKIYVKRK
jgi:hypothetical protein